MAKAITTPVGAIITPAFIEELRRDLVKVRDKKQLSHLSRVSRGRLNYHWLVAFGQGRNPKAHFGQIVILAQYLGRPLYVGSGPRFDKFELPAGFK